MCNILHLCRNFPLHDCLLELLLFKIYLSKNQRYTTFCSLFIKLTILKDQTMKTLLTILFSLTIYTFSFACTFEKDAFCFTINTEVPENTILRGMFSESEDNGMIFHRLETLRGEEDREFIKIWDNSTFDCNGPHERKASTMGAIGVEMIISFESIDSVIQAYDVIGDYRVPEGLWWETHTLLVEGDNAIGYFTYGDFYEGPSTVDLDILKTNIQDGTCILSSTKDSKIQNIEISPSLTSGDIYLRYNINNNEEQVHIFNNIGEIVHQGKLSHHIDLSALRSGVYFVIVSKERVRSSPFKIVKI